MKKTLVSIFIYLFITSCGFKNLNLADNFKIENLKTEGSQKMAQSPEDAFLDGLNQLKKAVLLSIEHASNPQYELSKLSIDKDPQKSLFKEFKDRKEKLLNKNSELSAELEDLIKEWKSFF